jgi:negative regulator of sigma-B (phosphoserine phosphatase)
MAAMTDVDGTEPDLVLCGWAGIGLEHPSGDLHVVAPHSEGALVGLVDGLGHGAEAAAASNAATAVLAATPGAPVVELIERCHRALRRTRGAVMTLASFERASATVVCVGVGNVEGALIRAAGSRQRSEAIPIRAGVVGGHLPPLRPVSFLFAPGDTLVLATDGIRSGFTAEYPVGRAPQEIAESILARFAKGTDDAHVVVARYVGDGR